MRFLLDKIHEFFELLSSSHSFSILICALQKEFFGISIISLHTLQLGVRLFINASTVYWLTLNSESN